MQSVFLLRQTREFYDLDSVGSGIAANLLVLNDECLNPSSGLNKRESNSKKD